MYVLDELRLARTETERGVPTEGAGWNLRSSSDKMVVFLTLLMLIIIINR